MDYDGIVVVLWHVFRSSGDVGAICGSTVSQLQQRHVAQAEERWQRVRSRCIIDQHSNIKENVKCTNPRVIGLSGKGWATLSANP